MQPRREFIRHFSIASLGGLGCPLLAAAPFNRSSPSFSGLSLSAYSMLRYMKWGWGQPRDGPMDMLGFLEYCAALGLQAAEITGYFFPEPLPKTHINAIRRRAHLLGLDISGGSMGNNFAFAPGSDQANQQLEYAKMWIDRFADIGAPVVRVFAGRKRPEGASDEEVIRNVIANLQEALTRAEKRGVMLGLENHDFAKNIDYLLRIVRSIDSPWLGVIWDSANFLPVPDPYKEMARIAPYALTAQVKVMTNVDGRDAPANYERIVQILKDANYRGYLTLEYEEEEDPYHAIPREIAKLRKLI